VSSSSIQRRLAVVAAALSILFSTVSAPAQGRWVKQAPFPEPDEELYGITANGKVYVLGGFSGGKTGRVYEYDPAADKWTQKKMMARPVHHQAMAEYRGKIYMFGGYVNQQVSGGLSGWEPVDNAWEYDPAADSWKALAPMPGKRGSAIAGEVGGKIYVIGGGVPQPNTAETAVLPTRPARSVGTNEVYDPATNRWETRSPMPTSRNHAFFGVVNNKIYVIGGRMGHSFISVASNTDVVEEYDPSSDSWGAIKARMPTPRSGGASATFGGRIYAAGGEFQSSQMAATFRALEAYNPATNTWDVLPSMPLPRHGVAGAILGNRLHLISGRITPGGVGGPDTQSATVSHDVFEFADK